MHTSRESQQGPDKIFRGAALRYSAERHLGEPSLGGLGLRAKELWTLFFTAVAALLLLSTDVQVNYALDLRVLAMDENGTALVATNSPGVIFVEPTTSLYYDAHLLGTVVKAEKNGEDTILHVLPSTGRRLGQIGGTFTVLASASRPMYEWIATPLLKPRSAR